MINPSLKPSKITKDNTFNYYDFYYHKNTLSSEESWLGIDLFNNDIDKSWWSLDDDPWFIA